MPPAPSKSFSPEHSSVVASWRVGIATASVGSEEEQEVNELHLDFEEVDLSCNNRSGSRRSSSSVEVGV